MCDEVFNCTHTIQPPAKAARAQPWRVINHDGADALPGGQHPGFRTVYSNTLNVTDASNAGAIHNCSARAGAQIGVVSNASLPRMKNVPQGANAYQFNAAGVDGLIQLCFLPVHLPQAGQGMAYSYTAKLDVYVAQAGWHEEGDALRVWAETRTDADVFRAVSLLPGCVDVATKYNVDTLMLRAATATPRQPYVYAGAANEEGDPALLADTWEWQTLSVDLVGGVSSVGVCAGLQSGAGAEELFIDNMRIQRTAGPPYHRKVCTGVALEDWAWPPRNSYCPGDQGPLVHPKGVRPGTGGGGQGEHAEKKSAWPKRAVAAAAIFSLFAGAVLTAIVARQLKGRREARWRPSAAYAAHNNIMSSEAEA